MQGCCALENQETKNQCHKQGSELLRSQIRAMAELRAETRTSEIQVE